MHTHFRDTLLVADIGGTNAKFALAKFEEDTQAINLSESKVYPCADYDSFEEILEQYQALTTSSWPKYACIAVAGPVIDDKVDITNLDWSIDQKKLKAQFLFQELILTNDFVIQAYATLYLDNMIELRKGRRVDTSPRLILGPGTGLGVASLIPIDQNHWQPQPGEGGHVGFAPETELEFAVLQTLSHKQTRVTVEDLVSGPGIERLYQTLCEIHGVEYEYQTAAQITHHALAHNDSAHKYTATKDSVQYQTVKMFLEILGSAAGNAALTLGAFNGVYFTGGILPKILPLVEYSDLVARFTRKSPMQGLLAQIPLYIVGGEAPALIGAAHLLIDRLTGKMQDESVDE